MNTKGSCCKLPSKIFSTSKNLYFLNRTVSSYDKTITSEKNYRYFNKDALPRDIQIGYNQKRLETLSLRKAASQQIATERTPARRCESSPTPRSSLATAIGSAEPASQLPRRHLYSWAVFGAHFSLVSITV